MYCPTKKLWMSSRTVLNLHTTKKNALGTFKREWGPALGVKSTDAKVCKLIQPTGKSELYLPFIFYLQWVGLLKNWIRSVDPTLLIASNCVIMYILFLRIAGQKLSDGNTLGGAGRLTKARIDVVQFFYGHGLRDNKGNPAAMSRSTWALLKHYSNPDHSFLPAWRG